MTGCNKLSYMFIVIHSFQPITWSFPGGSDGKEPACNAGDPGSIPRSRKIPWKREWLLTLAFLHGEFHGQRNLVGYSPWGRKELDATERLILFFFFHPSHISLAYCFGSCHLICFGHWDVSVGNLYHN